MGLEGAVLDLLILDALLGFFYFGLFELAV